MHTINIHRSMNNTENQESMSLVSAIKDVNLSKLVSKDTAVMSALLQDFFGAELMAVVDAVQRNDLLQVRIVNVK